MVHTEGHENLVLSTKEAELVKQTAQLYGISEEEAATLIVKESIARRVRRRTGKSPAKVYPIRKKP